MTLLNEDLLNIWRTTPHTLVGLLQPTAAEDEELNNLVTVLSAHSLLRHAANHLLI